ncbi:MAG: 1-deoxy-D-xylulose-5-phosphate synthase, partial [Bdellovibrionales bacterium]|nr:1-deoxy-D-xylulose-5-phosphate synthase [Bdellovibrionales bacterium]
PQDRLVWDVGHQGYIHKMLTGRRTQLASVRKKDGISGFLSRFESPYDCFGAGHAGTSISAALGMCEALEKEGSGRKAVAIIGDGSMTAGMAFEALNHAGALGRNLIVVLNDNEMSISPNVGAISRLFSKTVTSSYGTIARTHFKNLYKKGYVPELVYKAIDRAEEAAQGFFASASMLFEAFGLRYIGPIDGHNIEELVSALTAAKSQDVPVLVHAYTIKGKGYEPAEKDPVTWHGVKPFCPTKGEFLGSGSISTSPPSYTDAFSQALIETRLANPKVVAITAAMATGTGLDKFEEKFPESFYDVGICEQHAVTFAAGLATEGIIPVVAIYSTFLQRAYDQVVHDVCIQNLPVIFAMDRAGVVGNDGQTHQGVFDSSYLRCLPNMTLMAPRDENELRDMLYTATMHDGPIALRYPRGNGEGVAISNQPKLLPIGKAEILREGSDALIIALGPLCYRALEVAQSLSSSHGIEICVIDAKFVKPLDHELYSKLLGQFKTVCVLEDHALAGGLSSALLELVNDMDINLQSHLKRFGVQDDFVPHGSQTEQHRMNGFAPEQITEYLLSRFEPNVRAVNA